MRKEFENFLQTVHKGTTLDELAEHCQTDEELELALKKAEEKPCFSKEALSDTWKEKAWAIFKDVATKDINTKVVQIKLNVGYSLAIKIKNWLIEEK